MFEERKKKLVDHLKHNGYIKTKKVEQAFLNIPREEFVPENLRESAYIDSPLQIGNGQTISAPHMVAIMVEALNLRTGQKVLEIGTGSGYHAAIVEYIIGNSGNVYSIERHKNLAVNAKHNLKKANTKNIVVEIGDGSEGLMKYQPYDRIYVTCAAPGIPDPLINQLKDPGILLIPVGGLFCELIRYEKKEGKTYKKKLGGCAFVPLIGKYGH